MTQIIAYKQLTMRQEAGRQHFVATVAPAGSGKSHLLSVVMKYEHLHRRQWQTLAPSGVAADTVLENGVAMAGLRRDKNKRKHG